jgi:hypothetical protein
MRALIWKEYRNNRSLIWSGFGAIAAVYAIAALYRISMPWWDPGGPVFPWGHVLNIAALISLGAGVLIHVWFGAELIAKERSDRSAEFLAYLPVSRPRMLAAKGFVAVSHGLSMWLVNLSVLTVVFILGAGPDGNWPPGIGTIAVTAVLGFAAAWSASCVLTNPTACLGIGQLAPMSWGCFCASLPLWSGASVDPQALYIAGCLCAAPVLILGGVWEYLRRRGA